MKNRFLSFCMAVLWVVPSYAGHVVTDMRTLGMDAPIGIESNPAFSWKIVSNERGVVQSAYEIVVTDEAGTMVWSSGKVESSKQTDIAYEGMALKSRTRYAWQVVVYDQHGEATESTASHFETGILSQEEWAEAKWIAAPKSPYRAMVEVYPSGGAVDARFVKLDVATSGLRAASDPDYGFVQIAEIEIYNKEGENIGRKASFTATNGWELTNYGWSIKYINDGVVSGGSTNGFTTTQNSTTTTIVADLGAVHEVARIVLYPRQDAPAVGASDKAANFPRS